MTDKLADEIEGLAAKAGIGLWHGGVEFTVTGYCEVMLNDCDEVADCRAGVSADENNHRAKLIASTLNNLPAILAALREAEALRADRDKWKAMAEEAKAEIATLKTAR